MPRPKKLPAIELLFERYMEHLKMKNYSHRGREQRRFTLGRFLEWSDQRGIESVREFTSEILAAYRRHLFYYRNPKTSQPLKFSTQSGYLIAVRCWFAWLEREKILPHNVARFLDVPQEEQRLPASVLTAEEVERMLNMVDVSKPLGIRDRAMIETFYSTAIRCNELACLQVYDLEQTRGVIHIRQGKGKT